MSFHVVQPYNIGFNLPTARPRLQEYPSTMDILAENLGAGIGNAIPGMVQNKIKQGVLDQALARIDPNASALDKFITLHRADPELAKAYAPIFKEEMKQQRSLAEQKALGNFNNHNFGMQQQPSPVQSSANAPIENPSLPPRPGQQEGVPLAQAEMPNVDFTQLSPSVQKIVADATQKQKQLNSEEKRHARTESKDYRKEVIDNYKKSIFTQARLGRINELSNKKDLPTPGQYKLIQLIGLPDGVMSANAQELQKLSTDLLSGVTDQYKGRILEYEVKNFAHTIPSLMQSQEGRQRVINNNLLLKDPAALEYKTMKEIIKENKGEPPYNLQEQVTERMEGYLEDFKNDFGRVNDQKTQQTVPMTRNGNLYNIPKEHEQEAIRQGFIINE